MKLIFFIALPCALFALNAFLAFAAWRLFAPRKKWQIAALGVVLLEIALFLASFFCFATGHYDNAFFSFAWDFLAYAIVPMIYLSLWALAGTVIGKIFPRLVRFKQVYAGTGIVFVAGVCALGFWRFEHPQTHYLAWDTESGRVVDCGRGDAEIFPFNTGEKPRKMRLVATADWHLGTRIGRSRAEKFVALVNAQRPDAVVIAGDLFDGRVEPLEKENVDETLRKICAPCGVFFSFGNHEYFGNLRRVENFVRRSNIRLLKDEAAPISTPAGESVFCLIGRDDASNRSRASAEKLLSKRTGNLPALVLDHQPNGADELASAGANFIFCGHTHAGQFWPATWLVRIFNRYVCGLYASPVAGTPVFVTSGLGLWHIPYRIGCHSECVVIDIF